MASVPIDLIFPIDGLDPPANGQDEGGGLYTEWMLDNAAQFDFNVSSYYLLGSDIILHWTEKTTAGPANHKFQASVKLNDGTPQVFTAQFTSPGNSNRVLRSLTITSGGFIHGVAVERGDSINVVLSRIAASVSEDPNPIELYSINVTGTDVEAYGGFVTESRHYADYVANNLIPVMLCGCRVYIDGTLMGNCPVVVYRPIRGILKQPSYEGGVKHTKRIYVTEVGCSGRFVTDYITGPNMDLFLAESEVVYHSLEFVGQNAWGTSISLFWNRVFITAEGDHTLVGEDFQTLPFSFESIPASGSPMPVVRQVVEPTE